MQTRYNAAQKSATNVYSFKWGRRSPVGNAFRNSGTTRIPQFCNCLTQDTSVAKQIRCRCIVLCPVCEILYIYDIPLRMEMPLSTFWLIIMQHFHCGSFQQGNWKISAWFYVNCVRFSSVLQLHLRNIIVARVPYKMKNMKSIHMIQ